MNGRPSSCCGPYQIHAIEAVKNAVNPYTDGGTQSGFIWHTTGSGKTLTSYKTAHYLTQIPSVDKVIFVVDRKDLDNQTTGDFRPMHSTTLSKWTKRTIPGIW